jgi:hypothetical protein
VLQKQTQGYNKMTMETLMSRPVPNERQPLNERQPTATLADVGRAVQKLQREKYNSGVPKAPDLYSYPNPAEINQPVFTHEIHLGATAVDLEVENSAPQDAVEEPVSQPASNERQSGITVADIGRDTQNFKREQREMYNSVAPKDLGVYSITNLDQAPQLASTHEADLDATAVHVDVDVENSPQQAVEVHVISEAPVKAPAEAFFKAPAPIETTVAVSAVESNKVEDLTPKDVVAEVAAKVSSGDSLVDEAIKENETRNESFDRTIRTNVEGEFLVHKDARLRGLLAIGEELLALHNSKLTGEAFEKTVKPALEAKKAIYDDLFEMYDSKGLDNRALWYIEDKTNARVEDPDFIPIEGSPYVNGEKVTIVDFTETPDGKKAYTIENADGSIEAVYTDKVSFKREFEKAETREREEFEVQEDLVASTEPVEHKVVEIEPEEKLSRFERTKKWFGKEAKKVQEFGGLAYMGTVFSGTLGKAGDWLTSYHVNENEMTPEEIHKQRNINRRNNLIGGAALLIGAAVAAKVGFDFAPGASENLPSSMGTIDMGDVEIGHADGTVADGPEFVPQLPEAAENADTVPMLPSLTEDLNAVTLPEIGHADGGADFVPSIPTPTEGFDALNINVDNPVYNIPSGGEGLDLFRDLGLTDSKWYEHANELQSLYPNSFYLENGDVRIMNQGLLPLDVRQTIESFKNS